MKEREADDGGADAGVAELYLKNGLGIAIF